MTNAVILSCMEKHGCKECIWADPCVDVHDCKLEVPFSEKMPEAEKKRLEETYLETEEDWDDLPY